MIPATSKPIHELRPGYYTCGWCGRERQYKQGRTKPLSCDDHTPTEHNFGGK